MASIIVRDLDPADIAWAEAALDAALAGRWQARRGELVDVLDVPGLIAERDERREGLLCYRLGAGDCEIEALLATTPGTGIGTALVEELRQRVGGASIRVVTTNDNLRALGFYQRRGFRLVALRSGAVDESRRTLKPGIGVVGEGGIPIRDELELALEP